MTEEEFNQSITLEELNRAFDVAESETANWFDGHTCSMTNREGNSECPICFFRRRVKIVLGFTDYWQAEHRGSKPNAMTVDILKRWIAAIDVPPITDIYQTAKPNFFYASFGLPLYPEHKAQMRALDIEVIDTNSCIPNRYMLKWTPPSEEER